MQTIVNHKHFNTAKQIGFMPSIWSINDDSQERIRVQETKV